MPVAFSWGYSGWGNHTPQLVELVDAVETLRGYEAPLFVDVRVRRQVRAVGFRDRAFEQLLGDRYRWIQGLGNAAVADGSGVMRLADPSAIHDLVACIEEDASRRVIFFCSCESPHARPSCHRGLVVKALRRAAKHIAVQEWPGGVPAILDVDVTRDELAKLRRDALGKLPLAGRLDLGVAGALAHYSILRCHHGGATHYAATLPAVCTTRGWMLPIENTAEDLDDLTAWCDDERAGLALDAFGDADADHPPWAIIG